MTEPPEVLFGAAQAGRGGGENDASKKRLLRGLKRRDPLRHAAESPEASGLAPEIRLLARTCVAEHSWFDLRRIAVSVWLLARRPAPTEQERSLDAGALAQLLRASSFRDRFLYCSQQSSMIALIVLTSAFAASFLPLPVGAGLSLRSLVIPAWVGTLLGAAFFTGRLNRLRGRKKLLKRLAVLGAPLLASVLLWQALTLLAAMVNNPHWNAVANILAAPMILMFTWPLLTLGAIVPVMLIARLVDPIKLCRVQRAAAAALAGCGGPEELDAALTALTRQFVLLEDTRGLRLNCLACVDRILPILTEEHYGSRSQSAVRGLMRLLAKCVGAASRDSVAADRAVAICAALERCGPGKLADEVQTLAARVRDGAPPAAAGRTASATGPRIEGSAGAAEVEASLHKLLPILMERRSIELSRETLLRAGSADSPAPELLMRPAGAPDSAPEAQLLRPGPRGAG